MIGTSSLPPRTHSTDRPAAVSRRPFTHPSLYDSPLLAWEEQGGRRSCQAARVPSRLCRCRGPYAPPHRLSAAHTRRPALLRATTQQPPCLPSPRAPSGLRPAASVQTYRAAPCVRVGRRPRWSAPPQQLHRWWRSLRAMSWAWRPSPEPWGRILNIYKRWASMSLRHGSRQEQISIQDGKELPGAPAAAAPSSYGTEEQPLSAQVQVEQPRQELPKQLPIPQQELEDFEPVMLPPVSPRAVPREAGFIQPPPAPQQQLRQQEVAVPTPSLVPAAAAAGQAQPPAPTTGNAPRCTASSGGAIVDAGLGGRTSSEASAPLPRASSHPGESWSLDGGLRMWALGTRRGTGEAIRQTRWSSERRARPSGRPVAHSSPHTKASVIQLPPAPQQQSSEEASAPLPRASSLSGGG
ncbi:unnamed protein product [Vitrella brassicaformis CCMP3155]|uniref:Uncharacterized protein n=1 Tax=Vitrella brassicaformis (strain CCMP3155) TaxID=1169540 RepID=A0A0G4H0Q1_VITBC|nr:unnamed protein product [Vitrella brassicaformis CCMP3155]|eukprot:CEM37149.1 unnamed protein product [Vitrella brassicaformis CCMP3155]